MRVELRFYCEICGHWYTSEEEALLCEAQGKPAELPIGTIVGDSIPGAFYEKCIFAVAQNNIDGHWNRPDMWAARDNSVGDTFNGLCASQSVFNYRAAVIDKTLPAFQRMLTFLRDKGITPRWWDGRKACDLLKG